MSVCKQIFNFFFGLSLSIITLLLMTSVKPYRDRCTLWLPILHTTRVCTYTVQIQISFWAKMVINPHLDKTVIPFWRESMGVDIDCTLIIYTSMSVHCTLRISVCKCLQCEALGGTALTHCGQHTLHLRLLLPCASELYMQLFLSRAFCIFIILLPSSPYPLSLSPSLLPPLIPPSL